MGPSILGMPLVPLVWALLPALWALVSTCVSSLCPSLLGWLPKKKVEVIDYLLVKVIVHRPGLGWGFTFSLGDRLGLISILMGPRLTHL